MLYEYQQSTEETTCLSHTQHPQIVLHMNAVKPLCFHPTPHLTHTSHTPHLTKHHNLLYHHTKSSYIVHPMYMYMYGTHHSYSTGGTVNTLYAPRQCNTYVALISTIGRGLLDAIGHQAHDGRRPQKEGKTPHQVLEELEKLRELLGWSYGIGTIPPLSNVNLII